MLDALQYQIMVMADASIVSIDSGPSVAGGGTRAQAAQ
jgi:hypothetical protein